MKPFKYDIREYIKIYENCIPDKECKETLKRIKKLDWTKHSYVDANRGTRNQYDNDLSVTVGDGDFFDEQNKKIWSVLYDYIVNHLDQPTFFSWNGYTRIRYNRYQKGEEMRNHIDHISSIFDGSVKGVPVLTVLGALNNNYEGGKLVFFNDVEIPHPAGSIIVFPSTMMFPHLVTPVTKGVRYSFVSWVW